MQRKTHCNHNITALCNGTPKLGIQKLVSYFNAINELHRTVVFIFTNTDMHNNDSQDLMSCAVQIVLITDAQQKLLIKFMAA